MLTRTKNFLNSSFNGILISSINRGAGVGGFMLSMPIFLGVKIKTQAEIIGSSLIPAASVGIFTIKEYLLLRYLTKATARMDADIKLLESANDLLKAKSSDENLIDVFAGSYHGILHVLREENNDVLQNTLKRYSSASLTEWEKMLKYISTSIDVAGGALGGMSAIFIHFVVPIVLNQQFENENINRPALIIAILYSLHATATAYANNEKNWELLQQKRETVIHKINQYQALNASPSNSQVDHFLSGSSRIWEEVSIYATSESEQSDFSLEEYHRPSPV